MYAIDEGVTPWILLFLVVLVTGLLIHNLWLKKRLQLRLAQIHDNQRRLQLLTDNMTDFVWAVDAQSRLSYVSPSVTKLLGYCPDELTGQYMTHALEPDSAEFVTELQTRLVAAAQRGEHRDYVDTIVELGQLHQRGHLVWTEVAIRVFFTPTGDFDGAQGSARNVNERKKAQQSLWELAFYDPLTKLPNRRLLQDHLTQAVANAHRDNHYCAIFFLDLDNFKAINDTDGHDCGDALLVDVARRLQGSLRESDIIARYGGDEFVVVSQSLGSHTGLAVTQAQQLGEKILSLFREPFTIEGRCYTLETSVGAALTPEAHKSQAGNSQAVVKALLREADLAMYQAKTRGRNRLVVTSGDHAGSFVE